MLTSLQIVKTGSTLQLLYTKIGNLDARSQKLQFLLRQKSPLTQQAFTKLSILKILPNRQIRQRGVRW
jgi:hypothetical protein